MFEKPISSTQLFTFILALLAILLCYACQKPETDESLSGPKEIISFKLEGVLVSGLSIKKESRMIEITVPYGTYLKNLMPTIEISPNTSIVPASGKAQDFTRIVNYTLTGTDGSKVIYTIKIITEDQPAPLIRSFEKDTIEAGTSLIVRGSNFLLSPSGIRSELLDSKGVATSLENRILDSTQVKLILPDEIQPGNYQVRLSVNAKSGTGKKLLTIQYPSPQLKSLSAKNLIQGDTLTILGKYILPEQYSYDLMLRKNLEKGAFAKNLLPQNRKIDELSFVIGQQVDAGVYSVFIRNISDKKISKETFSLQVYDRKKPYVSKIDGIDSVFSKGQKVVFHLINAETIPTRFYQVQLFKDGLSYYSNGIYRSLKKTLSIDLPLEILPGKYNISISFNNSQNKSEYFLSLDQIITVE